MIVQLSEQLRAFVRDSVRSGRYASEEEVVRDALERLREQSRPAAAADLFGAMSDDADLLEEITREAMEARPGAPRRGRIASSPPRGAVSSTG